MHVEQLPDAAHERLQTLLAETQRILQASTLPHLQAIGASSMKSGCGADAALGGGSLEPPDAPPFKYDDFAYGQMHRAVYEAAEGRLVAIVIRAQRNGAATPWNLTTKLIGKDDYDSLVSARQPIDRAVEAELRGLTASVQWERASFGRDMPNKAPQVIRKMVATPIERIEPSGSLLSALERAQTLYKQHGLDLQIAFWTLRTGGLEFREHFE